MDNETAFPMRHNADRRRYEMFDGDTVFGKAHWLPYEGDYGPERIFFHTTVGDAYAGRGHAGELTCFALEDTIAAGLKIVPVCPFFKDYIRKHPEFKEHTVLVRPHHLEAVAAAAGQPR